MKKIISILFITFFAANLFAQEIPYPVATELNHPELIIERLNLDNDKTSFHLYVINQMDQGAWYCADKNIYIENPETKERLYITSVENIPFCPERHNFKRKGEKLSFALVFPSIKHWNCKRIDLVEDCDESCFYFKGLIIDGKLNADIHIFDLALDQFEAKNYDQAYSNFQVVLNEIPLNPTHVYGFSFTYLYKIAKLRGNNEEAKLWKKKFMESSIPNKDYYQKNFE